MKKASVVFYHSSKNLSPDHQLIKAGSRDVYIRAELFEGANALQAVDLAKPQRDEGIIGTVFIAGDEIDG